MRVLPGCGKSGDGDSLSAHEARGDLQGIEIIEMPPGDQPPR